MSKLLKLNVSDFLFFDIEVIREQETLKQGTKAYDLWAYKHRERESGGVPLQPHELIDLYQKTAGLNPVHSFIGCITVAFVHEGQLRVKTLVGDEKDIISEFCDILSKNKIPCGYNILEFDLPVVLMRAFKHGLADKIPDAYNVSGKKPWDFDNKILDLMKVIKGTLFRSPSFDEACYLMGVPSPKSDIDGSQVSNVYYSEGIERVARYCDRDVVACVNLFQALKGEEMFELTSPEETTSEEPLPELSPLEKIYRNSDLSDDVREEITKLIGKKRLTKKDKVNLKTILMGVAIHTDFVNQDQTTKADKERIELEVDEFINSL